CGVGADFKKSGAIPLGQVRRFNGAYGCSQRVAGSSKSLRQEMDKKGKLTEGKRWGAETKTTQ
uniref:hypothetical protein n=1 Tax=Aeromonas sp. QDB05 TaxID=2990478 RepID=UPI0022E5CAA1